ncbi:hypothetical protein ADU59_04265 [Pararhizobium polonicum]|uniref:Uncharacterized protein n=1 Tax=Pararhizobium polonicum TaxID=1612624 RepID=A0A1C7P6N1_9HYPH|nr:hypothetical protein [Pararhizobium polonicum]OBZ96938.1 hypothetical protein ADU59_04265 [Pararhizobium polonicum]
MRKLIIASIVAAGAALSFAAPSEAGGYYGGGYNDGYYGGGYDTVDHSYGHRRHHYKRSYYEPQCWIKKVRQYDYYGNLVVKRIRVCS